MSIAASLNKCFISCFKRWRMASEPALQESCSSKRDVAMIFQLSNRFLSFRTIRKEELSIFLPRDGGFFHAPEGLNFWSFSSLTFSIHSCDLPLLVQGINRLFRVLLRPGRTGD